MTPQEEHNALSLNLLFKDVFSITTNKVAVKSSLHYQRGYLIFIQLCCFRAGQEGTQFLIDDMEEHQFLVTSH